MKAPLITAQKNLPQLSNPGFKKPISPQMNNKVTAPMAQRQNTTSSTACPDIKTNHPIVPEMSMALAISKEPRFTCLSITHTPYLHGVRVTYSCLPFHEIGRASCRERVCQYV